MAFGDTTGLTPHRETAVIVVAPSGDHVLHAEPARYFCLASADLPVLYRPMLGSFGVQRAQHHSESGSLLLFLQPDHE